MRIRTLVLALALSSATAVAQETSITFYETLSPHGDWVVVESYGRVWRPYRHVVGVDFVPYSTGGRWVHSNHGWVFEPTYSWGWLPFHYGRWYQDPFNGWVWVPGDVWAPAWVEWRIGGGYIGWAPSPPRYHSHTRHHWYFVESRHFVEPHIWQHRAVAVNQETVWQATRPVPPSGRGWAPGPSVTDVRAAAPVPIPERRIEPPRPMQMFPKNMPPAAPPPPVPSHQTPGGPKGPGLERGSTPIQQATQPGRDNRPDPIQQAPQPQRQPPMQMQQPMPQRQAPAQMQPMPQPQRQAPAQMQPMPHPQRQAPTQMQPTPQRQPMPQQQRQQMPQPMPQQQRQPMPQPMPQQQRQPMPQAAPQPVPQEQQPQQGQPQRRPQPGQPFPGAGPQRGPPPGPPAGPPR